MTGVQISYRDHDDGEDVFLILHDDGREEHLEWDFVLEALKLRQHDAEGFDFVWHLIDILNDRLQMDGLDS